MHLVIGSNGAIQRGQQQILAHFRPHNSTRPDADLSVQIRYPVIVIIQLKSLTCNIIKVHCLIILQIHLKYSFYNGKSKTLTSDKFLVGKQDIELKASKVIYVHT